MKLDEIISIFKVKKKKNPFKQFLNVRINLCFHH